MSEAMGNRAGIERRVIERSLQDESFRQRLLEDPRATMEQELGVQLPAEVRVQAVEETTDTIYLVLPSVSTASAGGEIPDQELEAVAGGEGTNWTCGGWTCAGPSSTCETQYNTCGTDCTG
jgi:hypothetical protein